ncbi:Gfo/Idh/MocA family protein [Ramlibacter rhizophilus]|uniref:Gfo/Idh/MocA family oxidoreductase n=1 Tax=Ramlibacter rhizophilus TaxID=1781167 RepID=A0A4Z0BYC4_9BURK|nr:Gfo/Idh/MocA family oxidoreductase [Ramlibacter rhizophilus]TFZ04337.1 Gfo/Idh/MocA family oxidoreductase [Ramlibacter rhizophilus]
MTGTQGKLPRLGFLGLGWIGQHRMQALLEAGACEVAVVADPSESVRERVRALAPQAAVVSSLDEMLAHAIDGAVIATPSALHASQALQLLERGVAVFCQKPLARTAQETAAMVDAARRADRLLACDFSYRHTEAMRRVRQGVAEGEIGEVYAADMVFHNAWGPDKSWARDAALAGGGCAIDLGVHLVDLALWVLGFPEVRSVDSRLHAQGRRLAPGAGEVEDYAVAQMDLASGATVRLACSWNFSAGRDAVIEAHFHGRGGGLSMVNRAGSFYDFAAERYSGNQRSVLTEPPDAWGGRAIVQWARRLAAGAGFDPGIATAVQVASVIDRIYQR